jgi:hypothetical protein
MLVTAGMKEMHIDPKLNEPKSTGNKIEKGHKHEEKIQAKEEREPALLHSGPMLGDLPNLTPSKASPSKQLHHDVDTALNLGNKSSNGGLLSSPNTNPSRKADDKKAKKKKKKTDSVEIPPDMPKEFLCQLTNKPMSEPMKTIYGNVYDKTAIMNWFSTQGRICPLTGIIRYFHLFIDLLPIISPLC